MVSTFFCPISIPVATETSQHCRVFSGGGGHCAGLRPGTYATLLDAGQVFGPGRLSHEDEPTLEGLEHRWLLGSRWVQISGKGFGNIELESHSEDFQDV